MARGALILASVAAVLSVAAAASTIAVAQRADRPAVAAPVAAVASGPRVEITRDQLKEAIARGMLDREVKSLLNIAKPMRHGEFVWNDKGVPNGPVWVRVDLDKQLISVFRAGHEIGTAVILFGAEAKETPVGRFPIMWKAKDYRSITYDAPMPYSLRLTDDGVSIHGSNVQWGGATHGCIGVPLEFARRVFEQVKAGDEVLIVGGSAAAQNPSHA